MFNIHPPQEYLPIHEPITLSPGELIEYDVPTQIDFTEISLDKIFQIYPDTLYYPADNLSSRLRNTLYQQISEEYWIVLFNFEGGVLDYSLQQEMVDDTTSYGFGYDTEDTSINFIYKDGIEFMVAEGRYNLISLQWFQYGKKFKIYGNLTVEQAMSVAFSLTPVGIE